MTVSLRAHHLLCLLTYVGRGYTPAFTANMTAIAARLSEGEDVGMVDGPDDICGPLLADRRAHCHTASAFARDAAAAHALSGLFAGRLRAGDTVRLDAPAVARLQRAFASGAIRSACIGCEWRALCDSVAADGYRGAFL